jgi:predicted alpha/beta hydrolase
VSLHRPGLSETLAVRLVASDGCPLAGLLYSPPAPDAPRQVVVLHTGAGIAQLRYQNFARFLAEAGIPTLTYDYRGIGASRPASLRGFAASMEDWAEYDCAAAIGWLRERFPASEIVGIAHSIGTLLQGAAHNAAEQAQVLMVGAHVGYYGDYRRLYRLPMAAMWHGVMPALTRLLGYFPARAIGLGEDIPRAIALQWAGRRSADLRTRPGEMGHERRSRLLDHCAGLGYPVRMILASDDAFATPASARRLLSYYPRVRVVEQLTVTPADAGVERVGHFGFFRRRPGALLWPRMLAKLDTLTA